jgi:hypothetical protein
MERDRVLWEMHLRGMSLDIPRGKPILCVDFDGVIHSYTSPWTGPCNISDPPVDGALKFLQEATEHFRVHVFSSRSHEPGGVTAMKAYLHSRSDEWRAWMDLIEWPLTKPPFAVALDDRVLTFTGQWPSMETLKSFKPWNRK